MTPETPWISCAERMPTEADLPVWYSNIDKQKVWGAYYSVVSPIGQYDATHWRRAKDDVPAPPKPVVKTQLSKDQEAFITWSNQNTSTDQWRSWHAACAYKSKEIGERLGEIIVCETDEYGRNAFSNKRGALIRQLARELTEGAK